MTDTTLSNATLTTAVTGMCLVCGHAGPEHGSAVRVCNGVGGLCQCHSYSPREHPVQRLAAKRERDRLAATG